jgi:DNA-binding NarL/FixJ family response regulator
VDSIRIFLLDDHELVRTGLRALLESEDEFVIVGEASTAADALARIPSTEPDVAILDVRLPDGSGIDVCRDIRSNWPDVACIMLTSYADDEALFAAVVAGASGYVIKQVAGNTLLADLRRVAAGESLLDPVLVAKVAERVRGGLGADPLLAALTTQERRILELVADGRTNREIAATLFLAESTVKNYVSNLLNKMGMERRTQAASYLTRQSEREATLRRREATGT